MAKDLLRSKSKPVSHSRPFGSRVLTRNSQSSRIHPKSLKTLTSVPFYPERPGACKFSLTLRFQRVFGNAVCKGIFGKQSIPQIARLAAPVLRLFSHALRRQARNTSRLIGGRSFSSDIIPALVSRALAPEDILGSPPNPARPIRPRKRTY